MTPADVLFLRDFPPADDHQAIAEIAEKIARIEDEIVGVRMAQFATKRALEELWNERLQDPSRGAIGLAVGSDTDRQLLLASSYAGMQAEQIRCFEADLAALQADLRLREIRARFGS